MSGWPGMNDWENPTHENENTEQVPVDATGYMNSHTWQAMEPAAQARHFETAAVQCHRTIVPRAGGHTMLYQALCGGVIVSAWHASEHHALQEASRVIAAFLQTTYLILTPINAC